MKKQPQPHVKWLCVSPPKLQLEPQNMVIPEVGGYMHAASMKPTLKAQHRGGYGGKIWILFCSFYLDS